MNLQVFEKPQHMFDGSLDVHHFFKTIQGEGPFAGEPAIFIRLAGCNLECPLCDTEYTLERRRMIPTSIVKAVEALATETAIKLVVVSGGEPFRQNLAPTTRELIKTGFRVQVETNGTLFVPDMPFSSEDFAIVCSPKTPKINMELAEHINAFKYVLNYRSVDSTDGLPILALDRGFGFQEERVARPPEEIFGGCDPAGFIYVSPCDEGDPLQNKRHLDAAIKSCTKFGYTLCVQIHKLIGLE